MSSSRDPRRSAGTKRASEPRANGSGDAPRRSAAASGTATARARARSGATGEVDRAARARRTTTKAARGKAPAAKRAGTRAAPSGKSKASQPRRAKQPVAKRPTASTPTKARRASGAQAPVRKTTARKAATRKTTARKAPTRKAPTRKTPTRKTATRKTATRKTATRTGMKAAPTPIRSSASPRKRLVTLLVVMAIALGVIVVRLVDVQGIEGAHYEAMAEAQRVRTVSLAAERGSIFDRNGNDLALSVPQHTIYADPRVVRDPAKYASKLAPIVDVDRSDLRDRLAQPNTAFVYVARQVDDKTAARVAKLALPGVGSVPESKRFYPGGSLAGPVMGFVGTDNVGLSGLEQGYNKVLRGKPGKVVSEEDPNGRAIPATQRVDDPALRGGDLVLTLDQPLQYEVEKQLTAQVAHTNARGGIAIIADVKTGDVLAMASVDGAHGSRPARPTPATESNRPLTTVYEPGSTAKVITVGGALEAGVVQPDTAFWVPWKKDIRDRTFEDAEQHPDASWTVRDIVRESSNVGVIQIAAKLGDKKLDFYQRAFGFGSKTAIKFPYQSAGLMKGLASYDETDMGSIPIGYTNAVTPMQMLNVFVTVANGGMSRPSRLVTATIGADGVRHDVPVQPGKRVVSETTAAALNEMLRGVVTAGTGELAQVSGYTVAGKTGTSRKPPYEPARYMASFAGFAPAESPRLAAIVVIDQPGSNNEEYFGGKVAAPLFSTIMRYALRHERVPPTGTVSPAASSPGPAVETSTTNKSGPARNPDAPAQVAAPPAGIVPKPVP